MCNYLDIFWLFSVTFTNTLIFSVFMLRVCMFKNLLRFIFITLHAVGIQMLFHSTAFLHISSRMEGWVKSASSLFSRLNRRRAFSGLVQVCWRYWQPCSIKSQSRGTDLARSYERKLSFQTHELLGPSLIEIGPYQNITKLMQSSMDTSSEVQGWIPVLLFTPSPLSPPVSQNGASRGWGWNHSPKKRDTTWLLLWHQMLLPASFGAAEARSHVIVAMVALFVVKLQSV